VTVYTAATAPGVFTSQFGVGPAAVTHADGSLVTSSSPAVAGETVVLYVTGLGTTTPAGTNGVPGLGSPPYSLVTDQNVSIDILDSTGNDVGADTASTIALLTPQYPGEYQINFKVPSGLASGASYVNVNTNDGYTTQAVIYIK
jgi:uncharacterized protein (TIGR03437 family)